MKTNDYGRHIVQYSMEYSLCAGCSSCEIVCGLIHEGAVSPQYNRLFLIKNPRTMIHKVLTCQHCTDMPCYEACPKKDEAMRKDENGVAYVDEENCIGCGKCLRTCKFDIPRINIVKSKDRTKRKAKKCDLCRGREEGPACIEWCPVSCIGMSDVSVDTGGVSIER